MRRILIAGAAGLLGQHLVNKFKDKYSVLAVDIADCPFDNHAHIKYIQGDLMKFAALEKEISSFAPELVFNCAGLTDVDACETNRKLAYNLNVKLVENLLRLDFNKIIHFSSDYVFNGENGPYSEADNPDPIDYYGETKLLSEEILEAAGRRYVIIRSNVLFGFGKNIRPNYITWLIENLKIGRKLDIARDQFNNPIHAGNLADATIEIAESDYSGIIHIAGADYLSRYEIALLTAGHFRLDRTLINPVVTSELGQAAERPLKGGLKIDKARKLLQTPLLPFVKALNLLDKRNV